MTEISGGLEQAITLSQRVWLRHALGAIAVASVFTVVAGVAFVLWQAYGLVLLAGLLAFAFWTAAFIRTTPVGTLKSLRGKHVEWSLPSVSHGLVALSETHLLGGGIPAAGFDRHARHRLESVAYQEDTHSLTVDIAMPERRRLAFVGETNKHTTQNTRRFTIALAPSVKSTRAHDFARHARELSAR